MYDHVFALCRENAVGGLMSKKFTLARKHADKHRLYQLAVQDPPFEVDFALKQYKKRRGRRPELLREDFCGTAAVACEWARSSTRHLLDWLNETPIVRRRSPTRLPDGHTTSLKIW